MDLAAQPWSPQPRLSRKDVIAIAEAVFSDWQRSDVVAGILADARPRILLKVDLVDGNHESGVMPLA